MLERIGGPDRDRTGDLFHAMEARSQLRHRPTLRKDYIYSQTCEPDSQTESMSRGRRMTQCGIFFACRELIPALLVSKGSRVSEHSVSGDVVILALLAGARAPGNSGEEHRQLVAFAKSSGEVVT